MIWINLGLFLLACAVLVISGTLLIKSLDVIARFLRISAFLASFLFISTSTSLPELFVGISSALSKNTAIALGTVIGSNIADLTLVAGVAILLGKGLKIDSPKTKTDSLFMFFFALIPLVLMYLGKGISRLDGGILLAIFILNEWRMIRSRKRFTKHLKNKLKRGYVVISVLFFIGSIVLLYVSSNFVVKYATLLSIDLLLPPILIGLFLIALGTSLPELVFEASAMMKGKGDYVLGDLIGSVISNSTLVLGVTALIYPITANFILFLTSAVFMLVITFLFATFVASSNKLSWRMGLTLLFFYIFFLIIELQLKGMIV